MPPPRNAKKLFRSAKVKLQCVAGFNYSRAYKAEGDPSLNTPEAKLIRERMFMHKDLQSRFRRFWSILDLAKDPVTNELTAASYTLLSTKVQRVMIRDFDAAEAEQDAQKDWTQDVTRWAHSGRRASQVGMTYEAFQKSMFELADVWTEEIDVTIYCRFLDEVLGAVVQDINAEQLRFKRDEDISFNRRLSRRSSSRSLLGGVHASNYGASGTGSGNGSRLPVIGQGSALSTVDRASGLDVGQGLACVHSQPSTHNRRLSSQGTLREVSLHSILDAPMDGIEEENIPDPANVHQLEGEISGHDTNGKAEAKREANGNAKHDATEKAMLEANEKAKRAAAEKAKHEADQKAKREAAEMVKREANEKARHEANAKARRDAHIKAKCEAGEQGTGVFPNVHARTTERLKALHFERKEWHSKKDWDVLEGVARPHSRVHATRPPETVSQHSGSCQSNSLLAQRNLPPCPLDADDAGTASGSAVRSRRVYVSSATASERKLYMRAVNHAEQALLELWSKARSDSSTVVTRSRTLLDATAQCSPAAHLHSLQLCPVAAHAAATTAEFR